MNTIEEIQEVVVEKEHELLHHTQVESMKVIYVGCNQYCRICRSDSEDVQITEDRKMFWRGFRLIRTTEMDYLEVG